MRSARYVVFVLLAGLTFGSLLTTAGYAWYWRSAAYRNSCAATLSASLGLPSEIGCVVPRSRRAREFQDVRIWLPQRRGEAAFCERALVMYTPTRDDPQAFELELLGGRCEVSTRTWLREDYRFVLESGLRPGFDPAGPRRVVFRGMDLVFRRDRFQALLNDAAGSVLFSNPHVGEATITCTEYNGHVAREPVTLRATFSPQATGIRLDHIKLVVPEMPLEIVGLDKLADLNLRSGSFLGDLDYRETDAGQELIVSGKVFGLQLNECTAGLFAQPWRGSAPEVDLELTLMNNRFARLRFNGATKGAVLGDILASLKLPGAVPDPANQSGSAATQPGLAGVGGDLTLYVSAADFSPAGIERFVASGRCENVSLEKASQTFGDGRMSGTARVVIDDLTIVQNRVASLDAEIVVAPPPDGANWVERELVSEILRRTLGVSLPSFLPERFEFTQLGVRLEMRDEVLHVFGTHGPRGKTILTVKVGEQEIPLISEPEAPFDLRGVLDRMRARLAREIQQHLRTLIPADAWRALSRPPAPSTRGTP